MKIFFAVRNLLIFILCDCTGSDNVVNTTLQTADRLLTLFYWYDFNINSILGAFKHLILDGAIIKLSV